MIESMKQALEAYCKTLHPLWNTRISRTEAEGFFEAGFKAAIAEAEKQVAFKIYKPTSPQGAIPNVRDAELPWVYDQDPSSRNVASMWVTPVKPTPQPKREPLTEWKPIETAPKVTEVLLYCNKLIPLYIGKKRYGCLGEPQQDEFEWRCSSSGRFANPTYWMPLPKSPIEAAHGIKEDK